MSETSPAPVPPGGSGRPASGASSTPRLILMVSAVLLAVVGLLCLGAVLFTAFVQGTVWPGFIAGAYLCLPLAFILMVLLLISGVRARQRP